MARKLLLAPCGCRCGGSPACAACPSNALLPVTSPYRVDSYWALGRVALADVYKTANCKFENIGCSNGVHFSVDLSVYPPTITAIDPGNCTPVSGSGAHCTTGIVFDAVNSSCVPGAISLRWNVTGCTSKGITYTQFRFVEATAP